MHALCNKKQSITFTGHLKYALNGIPFVPQKLRYFPAIFKYRKIQTNPL